MPLSLTPQSLKRKLQLNGESDTVNTEPANNIDESADEESSLSRNRSSPQESSFFARSPTAGQLQSSPLRFSQTSSPTRSVRVAQIIHSTTAVKAKHSGHDQNLMMTTSQLEQMQRHFSQRSAPTPFPLELLKPAVLAEIFLKGAALERYFQRRYNEIGTSNVGGNCSMLKPLQRPFVRTAAASVPFSGYMERLFRYCRPEPLHLLAIVAYSERLIKQSCIFVPPAGWHRFVVAAWIVSGKALLGDQYWTNQYWARVAGISISEICSLEYEFILLFDWRLQVPIDELTAAWYLVQL